MADDAPSVSDFCVLNGRADSRLSDIERLTVVGGAGLDRAIRAFSRSLASFSIDKVVGDITLQQIQGEMERLERFRHELVFAHLFDPPPAIDPGIVHVHGFSHGDVYDLSFASDFPPTHAAAAEQYTSFQENKVSRIRFWEHTTKIAGRPTIIAIHGWTMGDQRVNSLAFMPGSFFSAGYDVALVELPLHGRRSPVCHSGAPLFPGPDAVFTLLALSNAIYDLRVLAQWLAARGNRSHVCVGMSLGAYVGQLWASLDQLAAAVFLVPLVSMGDLAYKASKAKGGGIRKTDFRNLFSDHCCLERNPRTEQDVMLIIGGRGDLMVPREQISLLKSHWPRAHFVWMAGGHAAHVRRGEAFRRIKEFLSPIARSAGYSV